MGVVNRAGRAAAGTGLAAAVCAGIESESCAVRPPPVAASFAGGTVPPAGRLESIIASTIRAARVRSTCSLASTFLSEAQTALPSPATDFARLWKMAKENREARQNAGGCQAMQKACVLTLVVLYWDERCAFAHMRVVPRAQDNFCVLLRFLAVLSGLIVVFSRLAAFHFLRGV